MLKCLMVTFCAPCTSMIVFVLYLIWFLVVPTAATSLFFLITIIALIDVVAGFSVTIRAARRDYSVGGDQ